LFSALLEIISEVIANILTPVNTIATNVMQCLDRGPRIIYDELDLKTKTQKPIERTTPPPTEVIQRASVVSGIYNHMSIQVM
jgi:hypothetical protein